MKLVLAAALPLTALPLIIETLGKVNAFQTLFSPGGKYFTVGQMVNSLLGLDAAEKTRLANTVVEVRQNLQQNYMTASGGGDLFSPFTPEKSAWLQNVLNAEINIAVQKLESAKNRQNVGEQRVFARYIEAFKILTTENKTRLEDAKRQINNAPGGPVDQTQKIGVAVGVTGLLLKLTGAI